jgi:uncharacterized protein (DUF488 family)
MTNAISRQPGKTIFTIGHGARSEAEFHEVLSGAKIGMLADVRRHPGSRRHPHFARDALAEKLPRIGIAYEWWGEALGGRRKMDDNAANRHVSWRNHSFRAYAGYMETPVFRVALEALAEQARGTRVVVMCAETLWWRCHRRLIADALVAGGHQVIHLGLGKEQPHHLSEACRIDQTGLLTYDASPGHPSG